MLRPFSRFCVTLGVIPRSIIESLSYEEQVMKLFCYIKDKIDPSIKENREHIEAIEYWIEHADFQEEVNNKLDEMAESGQLQEIISVYLNSKAIFGYDNVEDMTNASNLKDGSYARTLGYYSKNDGGSALYKIRTITNDDVVDNMLILEMKTSDALIAELIYTSSINVLSVGIKRNDSSYNSTTIIQNLINKNLGLKLYFPKGIYYITNINIGIGYNNIKLEGDSYIGTNKTVFMPYDNMSGNMIKVGEEDTTIDNMVYGFEINNINIKGPTSTKYNMNGIVLGRTSNVKITNVSLQYMSGTALSLDSVFDSIFDNIEINNVGSSTKYALLLKGTNSSTNAVRFINCRIESCTKYLNILKTFQIMFTNCKFEDNTTTDSVNPIVIGDAGDITFTSCLFTSKANPSDYLITFINNDFKVSTRFIGCMFESSGTNTSGGKYINTTTTGTNSNITIEGCYISFPNTNGSMLLNKCVFVNNTIFPHTFNDVNNSHIIEIGNDTIAKNNAFFGNSGANKPFAFKLIGSNSSVKENIYQNWDNTKRIDGINTYPLNILDYRTNALTGTSISSGVIDALQCDTIQVPANTTITAINNAWIGCELKLYANGSGISIDTTSVPFIFPSAIGTFTAGYVKTIRKVNNNLWMVVD